MALNKVRWGNAIAAAVQAVGVQAGTKITNAQLQLVWQAVAQENMIELAAHAEVAAGTFNTLDAQSNAPEIVIGIGGPIT